MKRRIILPILFFCVMAGVPLAAYAHDLIPKALQEYVVAHPNATADEIKAFVDAQDPEYAAQFKNGEEILSVVQNQNTSVLDNALDFFKIGVGHILSGPDHVLFVLSLLLVFIGFKEILKLSILFTVAHSITLVLSGTGILTISPSITEPIIAFSIAYVAITTVFFPHNKYVGGTYSKAATVFFFGLFHGLGFAGLLREIHIPADKFLSSLFSFNVGIEAGQLIIISLALPCIYFGRNKEWYPTCIKIFAGIIAILALFWFAQRIFFS